MGRKPKNQSRNKKPSTKVSETEEEQEIWDLVRIIPKHESKICRMENCKEKAVATWATNLDPDDKWDMCEDCQLEDFGGWPEGVEPDESDEETNDNSAVSKEITNKTDPTPEIPTEPKVFDELSVTSQTKDVSKDNLSEGTPMVVDEIGIPVKDKNQGAPEEMTGPAETGETATDIAASVTDDMEDEKSSSRSAPTITQEDPSNEDSDEEDADEMWDLKKILPYESIVKEATIKCSNADCILPACSIWVSNLRPTQKWYSCIDCQDNDFDGWPPLDELPLTSMEPKHLHVIAEKCSKQKNPAMPSFPCDSTSPSRDSNNGNANFVTPSPNHLGPKDTKSGKSQGDANKITPTTGTNPKKPSAGALAMHKKWQEAAEAMGGKEARIVVSKDAAKKLIFDQLFDAFRPMNITEIYKELKAVVPSPVLNACLQDMALEKQDDKNPFDDSDDEQEESKKVEQDQVEPFAGSLFFKAGRNQSSNLYYVNHNKLKEMDRDQREALFRDAATAKAEEEALKTSLKNTLDQATKLLSEPTNEELTLLLDKEEVCVKELEDKLEEARKLKVNEKHKLKTKKQIQSMAAQWRKRKRLCMDFLISLEENTDGVVTAKKCLNGDGQLALDSDEAAAKAAIQYVKDKRSRGRSGGLGSRKKPRAGRGTGKSGTMNHAESLADESFVAVSLDAQHNVCRIYVDDDE